jgi:ubiquinone biosynthesis protein COQ4
MNPDGRRWARSRPQSHLRRRREWRRAWRALSALIDDPERTDQVFEIIDALAGTSFDGHFERFRAHPDGQRILRERPSLLATLSDRERLRAMPDGSLGRRYAEFMDAAQLDARGLVEADEQAASRKTERIDYGPDRELFGDRLRDMHDLWHVLTGYGRDQAGEAANLAFSLGQIPELGIGLIVGAAALLGPKAPPFHWQRYLLRAWQRGRRAALLSAAPYEELLELPIEEARRRLKIEPPEFAHPAGIIDSAQIDAAGVAATP